MPKHKKTRAQKKVSDVRNSATLAAQHVHTSPTYVFSAKNISPSIGQAQESGNTISIAQNDLRKTALISIIIVGLELLFYFLLSHHMLAIGFVRY